MDLYPLLRVLSQPGDSLLLEFLFQKANLILSLPFPALFSKDSPRALLALNSAPNNSSDPPGTTPQPPPLLLTLHTHTEAVFIHIPSTQDLDRLPLPGLLFQLLPLWFSSTPSIFHITAQMPLPPGSHPWPPSPFPVTHSQFVITCPLHLLVWLLD